MPKQRIVVPPRKYRKPLVTPLREYRMKSGLTLMELGARVGVTAATIWRYETGNQFPRLAVMRRLMKETGLDADDLVPEESMP